RVRPLGIARLSINCMVHLGMASPSLLIFFSSRRRHTSLVSDWSSDVCSSDLAQWWEDGCRHTKVLGQVGSMTPIQAQIALTEILRPINEGRVGGPKVPYTFGRFLEDVYLPHCRRTWKASTAYTSEHTV